MTHIHGKLNVAFQDDGAQLTHTLAAVIYILKCYLQSKQVQAITVRHIIIRQHECRKYIKNQY